MQRLQLGQGIVQALTRLVQEDDRFPVLKNGLATLSCLTPNIVVGGELTAQFPTSTRIAGAQLLPGLIHVPDNRVQLHKGRSEEHTSELQSRGHLVCRLLLEK